MPISRKRTCTQCRAAKTRCSLTSPCLRCAERGVQCTYRDTLTRDFSRGHLRESRQHFGGEPSASRISDEARDATHLSGFGASRLEDAGPPILSQTRNMVSPPYSHDTFIHPSPDLSNLFDVDYDGMDGLIDGSTLEYLCPLPVPTPEPPPPEREHTTTGVEAETSSSLPWLSDYTMPRASQFPICGLSSAVSEVEKGLMVIYGTVFDNVVLPKGPTSIQTTLMAQVLWGQVRSYPEMMIHGHLPPFIYPRCVLDGRLPKDCIRNGVHTCFPQSLAVCANLTRMFCDRTPESSSFVWETIKAEQTRLSLEFMDYDVHELLAALQAINIYVILQAQDLQSMQLNDIELLGGLAKNVAQRLWKLIPRSGNIYRQPKLTHREWALYESMIRAFNLAYIQGCLINALLGRESVFCSGTDVVPLVGPRILWDYATSESWAARFDRFKTKGLPQHTLNIRHLSSFVHQKPGRDTSPSVAKELSQWCEEIDEFGTLVWMSASLDRSYSSG